MLLFNSASLNPIFIFFGVAGLILSGGAAFLGMKLWQTENETGLAKVLNRVVGVLFLVASLALLVLAITLFCAI